MNSIAIAHVRYGYVNFQNPLVKHYQKTGVYQCAFFHSSHRVGIIGEPISGFNPLTLAPFGEEQEEETGVEDSSREG